MISYNGMWKKGEQKRKMEKNEKREKKEKKIEKKERNRKHMVFYELLRPCVVLFLKIKFGYQYKTAKNLPDNFIVLSNHVTDYDPLFVGASFKRQMYFVASEHISRWGWVYSLIDFLVAPITRKKGMLASAAVMDVMRKVHKGNNVCMFAEGVRSWDGRTCPIAPATAKLIKRAGCGLVTYRISGGYFASPMWGGASVRRGKVYGAPVNVYTKERLAEMTEAEVYAAINEDLYEDAYETQLLAPKKYRGKNIAEHLENLMFICPKCGKMDTFSSKGNTVSCNSCDCQFEYDEFGMLSGGDYRTLAEFSDWQKEKVREAAESGMVYTAEEAVLTTVEGKEEVPVSAGKLSLDREKLQCGDVEIQVKDMTDLAMHGQRTLVFAAKKKYYELRVADGYNALKFQLYYQACFGKI